MQDTNPTTTIEVNGTRHEVRVPATTPLMYVLRNHLGLKGVRAGCSIGECGSCRVIIDGTSTQSCTTPMSEVAGASIVTPEGLGGPDDPHPVQEAFLDTQAGQCAYCINGMIVSVAALLDAEPDADEQRLRTALDEHICRCGTHQRIVQAACRAAGRPVTDHHQIVDATDSEGEAEPTAVSPSVASTRRIADWIEIDPDGHVTARPGKVELGQGVRTAFHQIVASQLGLPLERVSLAPTVTDASPDEGQTSGSFSIEVGGIALGMAAVALRRVLVGRAAALLDVDPESVSIGVDGASAGDRTAGFADLLEVGPIEDEITDDDLPDWRAPLLGDALHRDDLRAKLTGAPAFVQDLDLDGMLHARVLLPANEHTDLVDVDLDEVGDLPGVIEVARHGQMVFVVAEHEEDAIRAHGRLARSARWEAHRTIDVRDTEALLRSLEPVEESVRRRDDDVDEQLSSGTHHRATYVRPYQAHGPMSPSAAVAVERDGHLHVWSHTQGIYPLRRELAALLGRDEASITLEHHDGPGCYGQTASDDAAAFAAIATGLVGGRPVRLQLSIADEFTWDPHGPGSVMDLEGSIGEDGRMSALRFRTVTDSHSARANGDGDRLVAAWLGPDRMPRRRGRSGEPGMRNALPLYDIPAMDISAAEVFAPLRIGPLRSLGAFPNVFAIESFVDELAELAGEDPVEFRLRHLTDERAIDVLRAVAEGAGWEPHVGPSGRGMGVALARYKDTKGYAAAIAEVEVDAEQGTFRVTRMRLACDAGAIVNPDGLRNQLEGGIVQGLSRTLHEELHLTEGGVREQDWTSYRTLRFDELPSIEVTMLDRRDHPPLGAGEVSTPLVPAAVANAIDDAIGIRLRTLPLTPERLQQRLLDMDEDEMQRVLLD
jgi:nicotinate dehydrogenase subunit B